MTLPSQGMPERQRLMLFDKINRYGRSSRKSPFEGGAPTQEGWGMLVRLLGKLLLNPINIPLRLLGNLFVNPINIPLRRSAFATRRCPPSKGDF